MTYSKSPPLRILQIVISPDPGGVLALSQSIGRGLTAHGYAVETAFVVSHPGASYVARARGAVQLAWQMATCRYEALIGYQPSTSILVGVIGAVLGNTKRIVHQTTIPQENSSLIQVLDRLVGRTRAYRHNVVNTVHTRNQYCAYPRAYRARMVLIEHGVPVPRPQRSRAATLERYGIPDDGVIVINTARLVAEKNHEVVLRALSRVTGVRLVVAGDGALRNYVEGLVSQFGLKDRVHLLGALSHADALELYGAADAFAFPSLHETFGISAVEAAMFGLPVIASDIPVLREVLQAEGNTAVRFEPPTDAAAWEVALQDLVSAPPDLEHLQNFARALSAKYSEERMLQSYLTLLRGESLPAAFAQTCEVSV